jgi:lipopolysaccharide biosynthesis protein
MPLPRLIAFYLPQFHPIPENDVWWGKGFTEWTNVIKARPLFKGHYQPQLPADLGFYDLRLPEAREAQAALAREYGIHGFCYYHYWFNGRRLLERPFNEVLASGKPGFPFCLCWANENWTRRWDGQAQEVLLGQNYSDEDDLNHIRWLATAFRDPRYVRVRGRPMFLVYRVSRLPNPGRTIELWRNEARRLGVGELFLCNVEGFGTEHGMAPKVGLDAAVEFAPDWSALPLRQEAACARLARKLLGRPRLRRVFERVGLLRAWLAEHRLFSYERMVASMQAKPAAPYRRFSGVTPSWDNSARCRTGATIIQGSTPELYQRWLAEVVQRVQPLPEDERVVFVNAWNEWAEGNHLEPCQRWGRAYLEATRAALGAPAGEDACDCPSFQPQVGNHGGTNESPN